MNTNSRGPDPARTRSFTRRLFIRGAAIVGATTSFGGLLAACSPAPTASPPQPTAAKQMYTRIQQIILDENPHIFLFNALKLDALQGYVQGYTPAYTGFRESLRQTWLAK
jgi:hypothetical protein